MERGIYADQARLFAPYYRQAAMKVYAVHQEDRKPWMQFAYADVSTAFAYYLEYENQGRPVECQSADRTVYGRNGKHGS